MITWQIISTRSNNRSEVVALVNTFKPQVKNTGLPIFVTMLVKIQSSS